MPLNKSLNNDLHALILAGGVGSRFWPFSRELEPKQFLKITGDSSLIQGTISRLKGLVISKNIHIVTNKIYYYELKKQISKFNIPEDNIILEPEGKNTAPAIGLCAQLIKKRRGDAILLVLPSDHHIRDINVFRKCILSAKKCAQNGLLATIGIKPIRPSTGYGYIKIGNKLNIPGAGNCYRVERFLEKPVLSKAKKYISDGGYLWNSGMFAWKVSVFLEEVRKYIPELYGLLSKVSVKEDIPLIWNKIKPVSVDYGIMEHSKNLALVPGNFRWTDLGSWDALEDILHKDIKGNIVYADSIDVDSHKTCIFSRSRRLIATVGLNDLIIADTPDALLVSDRSRVQEVKRIVDILKSRKREEQRVHLTDKRPWGSYTVLQAGSGFKIKLVEIDPKKRLSLQKHSFRAEHWVVVSGCAKVTSGKFVKTARSNESIYIPRGQVHRLENPGKVPVQIVEVQTGSYLEEDDIQRFDDDFIR